MPDVVPLAQSDCMLDLHKYCVLSLDNPLVVDDDLDIHISGVVYPIKVEGSKKFLLPLLPILLDLCFPVVILTCIHGIPSMCVLVISPIDYL